MVAALALALLATGASAAGYRDFSYAGPVSPTREKPQSKLWFNDGVWWGSLFRNATDAFEVFRFDPAAQRWTPTGTVLDARDSAMIDALWDGSHLYVASAGPNPDNADQSARVYRFSYDPGADRYSLDAGFPVTVVNGGMEALVLDKDSTGRLWITYTRSSRVWVARTTGNDATWLPALALPVGVAGNITADDISSVVAFDGKIGVAWSNQTDGTIYFATHPDGAPDHQWAVSRALHGAEMSDDHLSVKALSGDPAGRVYIASKTSLNDPGDPLIVLSVLGPDGAWRNHIVARVADAWTRAEVVVDPHGRGAHVFGAVGPCCNGGAIYLKSSNLDNPSFAPGAGSPLIETASDRHINNPTSTKQPIGPHSGLLVEASDNSTNFYLHNFVLLAAQPPPPPAPPQPERAPTIRRARGVKCTIVGTQGNDVLRGTRRRDVICGLGGRDRIYARGGRDIVSGGAGHDRIAGGGGGDRLYGDSGSDRISGGTGNDRLYAGGGRDRLSGGRGRDRIADGSGADRIYGNSGNDTIIASLARRGRDVVNGGRGRDRASVNRLDRVRSVERFFRMRLRSGRRGAG